MYQMGIQQALNQYRDAGVIAEVSDADPHRLIQLLFEGALDRIAIARGAMRQGDVAVKGSRISRAIQIIDGLRAHLDREKGGEIAANLDALYDYMERRLAEANLRDDITMLDEVANLLREVKSGWEAIPQQRAPTAMNG
ncbi:MAG: flagella export chaperone FliS [Thioalkalivibrio sp.]|nr:MAG: flagella export chaperone FliS [Thioalkalivibrio sp.]